MRDGHGAGDGGARSRRCRWPTGWRGCGPRCAGLPGVTVSGVVCDAPVDYGDPVDLDGSDGGDAGPPWTGTGGRRSTRCSPARRTAGSWPGGWARSTCRSIRAGARSRCRPAGCGPTWPGTGSTWSTRRRRRWPPGSWWSGAESTGTSTVAALLAMHYRARGGAWGRTRCVTEAGRDYTITKWQRARPGGRGGGPAGPGAGRARVDASGLRRDRGRADQPGEPGRGGGVAAGGVRHRRVRHLGVGAPVPGRAGPRAAAVGHRGAARRETSTCSPRTRACRGTTTDCARVTWPCGPR